MSALHDHILAHFQRLDRPPAAPATIGDVLDVAMMLADEIERVREDMVEGGIHVRDFVKTGYDTPLPVERKVGGPGGQVMNFLDFEAIRNAKTVSPSPAEFEKMRQHSSTAVHCCPRCGAARSGHPPLKDGQYWCLHCGHFSPTLWPSFSGTEPPVSPVLAAPTPPASPEDQSRSA